jgi:hypothetical protein
METMDKLSFSILQDRRTDLIEAFRDYLASLPQEQRLNTNRPLKNLRHAIAGVALAVEFLELDERDKTQEAQT